MALGISRRASIAFCFLVLVRGLLSAQDFSLTVYDESRGFNRNYVNDIIRDGNGFIWLATDKGVVRFDGVNFVEPPAPAGSEGDVLRLRLFGDNLYLVYRGTGVGCLNLKTYQYSSISDKPVGDILQLSDEVLLILFGDGRLVRMVKGIQQEAVNLGIDAAGTLHSRWGKVLAKTQPGGLMAVDPMDLSSLRKLPVSCCPWMVVFHDIGNKILLSSGIGFFEIDSTLSVRAVKPLTGTELENHSNWIRVNADDAFFISRDTEVIQKRGDDLKRYTFEDKRISGLRKLFLYDSADLLVGTNGSLLHLRIHPPTLTSMNQDKAVALPDFRVRRKIITLAPDHFILLGNPGFIEWRRGQFRRLSGSEPISSYDGAVFGDEIFTTTENSFEKYSLSSGNKQVILTEGITSADPFYALDMDSTDGSLVLGGKETMFRYYPRKGKALRTNPIGTSSARVVHRIPGKNLWAVGATDGLYFLNEELSLVRKLRKSEGMLRGQTVSDLLLFDASSIWITHERGAEKISLENYQVTDSVPASAFTDSRVTAVLKDDRNHLWFSTFKGILGFDPVSRGIVKLGSRNNLINREYNYKSAAVLPDGRLMFGGLDGYDFIDPTAFSFNTSRPDGIIAGYRRIHEDGMKDDFGDSNPEQISFDTEHESLRIYITTAQLLNSATNRYEFRLNGGIWSSLDGLAHLDIYKLRPGNYSLEFRGFDQFGTLITFPKVLLRAEIVFYKSLLFIWSAAAMVVALSVMIVLIIRRNRIRERRIKEAISMDLHDEVGTILTKAVLAYRNEPLTPAHNRVEEYLKEGLHSLRVFIDTMNETEMSLQSLVVEIRENIFPATINAGISAELEYDRKLDLNLPAVLFRDIKLCLYESVSNAMKYSSATRLKISLQKSGQGMEILLSDNGCLKDVRVLENKGGGIGNLRKRVEKYDGQVDFSIGAEGHGLEIRFRFPL